VSASKQTNNVAFTSVVHSFIHSSQEHLIGALEQPLLIFDFLSSFQRSILTKQLNYGRGRHLLSTHAVMYYGNCTYF